MLALEHINMLINPFFRPLISFIVSSSPVFLTDLIFSFLLQDLQEEGQVVQVGSLGARWVLMQHAEPWLLTVADSKQWSHSHPASDRLKDQHNRSLRGKRCRREAPQETEGPPAKRSAVDKQEGEDAERLSSDIREKLSKEEQMKKKGREDEGSGDKLLNLEEEGGKQMQPEEEREEAGKEKVETEERQEEKKKLIAGEDIMDDEKEEAGPAGVDDE